MKLTKAGQPRKQRQTKAKPIVKKVDVVEEEDVSVSANESETVISYCKKENKISIETNLKALVKKYRKIKQPDKVFVGGLERFVFSLDEYSFSLLPKKIRGTSKTITEKHKAALVAGRKKNEEN